MRAQRLCPMSAPAKNPRCAQQHAGRGRGAARPRTKGVEDDPGELVLALHARAGDEHKALEVARRRLDKVLGALQVGLARAVVTLPPARLRRRSRVEGVRGSNRCITVLSVHLDRLKTITRQGTWDPYAWAAQLANKRPTRVLSTLMFEYGIVLCLLQGGAPAHRLEGNAVVPVQQQMASTPATAAASEAGSRQSLSTG